jgi:hypothetical protein
MEVHPTDLVGPFARIANRIGGSRDMLTGVTYRTGVAPALLFEARTGSHAAAPSSLPALEIRARIFPPHATSQMRLRPIGLLLSGIVVASSACSMDATVPTSSLAAPASAAKAAEDGQNESQGQWNDGSRGADRSTYVVTIDPKRPNVLRFGAHRLEIPAGAICADDSGYGLAYFDLGCKSEKDVVTITAVVRSDAHGIPHIDLLPRLRFSPERIVTLTLWVPDISRISPTSSILYCPTSAVTDCIDEAQLDSSLATHVDDPSSTVFRRIKHFSGYFISE